MGCIIARRSKPLFLHAEASAEDSGGEASVLPILRHPAALVSLTSACVAALTIGYMESLLELHLEVFSLSVTATGLCFLAMALAYTSVTILTGCIADKAVRATIKCYKHMPVC